MSNDKKTHDPARDKTHQDRFEHMVKATPQPEARLRLFVEGLADQLEQGAQSAGANPSVTKEQVLALVAQDGANLRRNAAGIVSGILKGDVPPAK